MSVDELITENINLVYWVLSKYYPAFLKDDDLVQIGMLGLIYAARRFDESRGYPFAALATKCIRDEIRKEFIKRCADKQPISLDGTDEDSLYDYVASDADLRDAELRQHYMEFLEQLDDVSRDLVKLRRSGVKIEDAAKHVGLTKSGAAKRMRSIKSKWATWLVQYDD